LEGALNVPEFIVQSTLVLLVLAVLVFGFQAVRQRRSEGIFGSSFPTILLVVIVGWITTEVVSDTFGTSLGIVGEWAHLAVMFLFAACITIQLRHARKS
jgi:formate hydrogenlyase subunit 3/multisubunit Na+/H+ antiporter MnhD subunit